MNLSASLNLKNSSVKSRGLSTEVTTENVPSESANDVQSLRNNPVSFIGLSASRRAPKPPPRRQITLDHSEAVSQSSDSYAEQAILADCQTPASGISMSSLGSVFCDELESKQVNSFGNARFPTDFTYNTDSPDTKLTSKNCEMMLQDLQQPSECTDYPLLKESDLTGSSIGMKNC